jgi:imidazoleglycerol-phosphate dehydratase
MNRKAEIIRKTNETNTKISLDLDGTGNYSINTGIGFFDHLLESFSKHSSIDLTLIAEGDLHVDQHHLIEDCGIVLGEAFCQALGDKRGINRAGFFILPMDETLATAVVDFSGRPYLQYDIGFSHQFCGSMEVSLIEDFLQAFASHSRANVMTTITRGRSDHHKAEATFKALARAIKDACAIDGRIINTIPSTKGVL